MRLREIGRSSALITMWVCVFIEQLYTVSYRRKSFI